MNIFYLDHDPVKAAQMMTDRHVVKMIVESAQLLCTNLRMLDGTETTRKSKSGSTLKEHRIICGTIKKLGREQYTKERRGKLK
jgi:hypothetical protein